MASQNVLVGAIDFGTTYSGWACSFLHEFETNPTKGYVKQWHSGSETLVTEKAPTCLLIRPDGQTFEAFGYEAENKYRQLAYERQHEGYYYFRRFKMMLNTKLDDELDRKMTLEDEMGKSLLALDVFCMAIKHLVEDMIDFTKNKVTSPLKVNNVFWVLTVPAIWTDAAKQFMREAAIKAGITSAKLTIALEPEAASIFCRHLSVKTAMSGGKVLVSTMSVGTRYMILDAGGGTIDITVHEVVSENEVKEVQKASGGGWGGILVDKAFENFLIDLAGKETYDNFKLSETEDWLDLFRAFEVKKRFITPENNARINMKFPLSFCDTFEKVTNTKFEDAIAASKYAEDLEFGRDKMKFSASLFKSFFETSVQKIVEHMKAQFRYEGARTVRAILMVGGFSGSAMLQQAMKDAFPDKDIIIPFEASSTILKGALVYGHSPKSITERVLRYTYGIETLGDFREGIDPVHFKTNTEVGVKCRNIFSKLVEKDQIVKCYEKQVEKYFTTAYKFQRSMTFTVYASTLTDTRYTDNCIRIGKITLEFPEPEESPGRTVLFSMTFGRTEIEVEVVDIKTGKEARAHTDFLEKPAGCFQL